jgi:membrane peptidoglycan carboxypeptidase
MQTSLARRERRRRSGNRARRPQGGAFRRIAVILPMILLSTFVVMGAVAFVGAVDVYTTYSKDLGDPKELLQNLNFNQKTTLYDRTGTIQLASFGSENRRVLAFKDIAPVVLDATTSAEDKTFWTNAGFDPRAFVSAIADTVAGNARGASTITQQLVRQRLLPPTTSTVDRKIKEIIQSVRLTQEFPGEPGKEEIITDYLNQNFYGNQSYGIAAAAQGYFGVTDLSKLTPAQSAILAALLQSPSTYDLVANGIPQADGTIVVPADTPIVERRNYVLEQMRQNQRDGLLKGTYSDAALLAAETSPVILPAVQPAPRIAPQFDEQVRSQLADLLCGPGTQPDECQAVDTGGFKVITTLDVSMQQTAEKYLKAYTFGGNQLPGSTDKAAQKAADIAYLANLGITLQSDPFDYKRIIGPNPSLGGSGDAGVRLGNIHNAALISLDYRTGQVLTYAGSADFYEKPVPDPTKPGQNLFDPQFDVLSSGVGRQPGSSFKPINYTVGIQDGTMTAASLFMDVATNFGGGYTPHDADGFERGPVRLREALQFSLNIPAVKAASINGVAHLMQRAQDFGLVFPPNSNPGVSIGVGTVEVHPADLTSAYGALANGGVLQQRTMILSVLDSKGAAVWSSAANPTPATHPTTPQAAYVTTNILASNTDPVQNPWWGQYQILDGKTSRPATLKTGTSDQVEDLFALGYVAPPADPNAPAIVTGVWAGNSDHTQGKELLSLELAAPLWHAFMQTVTAGTPIASFKQPTGIVTKTIDAFSGMLPGPYTRATVNEVFVKGTEPTQVDNTKVPVDVDAATNTLWSYDCPGTKVTKGFLDLSQIDAANPNFQKYDHIWIATAKKGVGTRGGPNNAPTNYFYETSFWIPPVQRGLGWGAPFVPTKSCTQSGTTPPSGWVPPTASPSPEPSSVATPGPTTPTPTPSALLLAPMGLWGLFGKLRTRRGRCSASGSRGSNR